jgi:hypothetical protein
MFPRARKLLSAAELVSLGERMATRKQELLAAPSGMVAKAAGAVLDAISPREDDEDDLPELSAVARKRSANGRGTGARTR